MELPGYFFVDSMDVALSWVTGPRWDEELLPPLVPRAGGISCSPGVGGQLPG